MKIKVQVGQKMQYVTDILNSTKDHPVQLMFSDNTEKVWTNKGYELLKRKFPFCKFIMEV